MSVIDHLKDDDWNGLIAKLASLEIRVAELERDRDVAFGALSADHALLSQLHHDFRIGAVPNEQGDTL